MRVTKLVREYVEETVRKAYRPKIDACRAEYDRKKANAIEDCEKLIAQWNELAKQIVKANGLTINNSYCGEEAEIVYFVDKFGSEEWLKVKSDMREVEIERDQKIKDILITLELGGTKDDLDRMIEEIAG